MTDRMVLKESMPDVDDNRPTAHGTNVTEAWIYDRDRVSCLNKKDDRARRREDTVVALELEGDGALICLLYNKAPPCREWT